jgi:hypothetical protein
MYIVEHFEPIDDEDIGSMSEDEKKAYYLESINNRKSYYLEAQRYLWLLSLNLKDVDNSDLLKFEEMLKEFIEDSYNGEDLRQLVLKFARNDSRLKGGMALVKQDNIFQQITQTD